MKLLEGMHTAVRCHKLITSESFTKARAELSQLQAELHELDGAVLEMPDALAREALRRSERWLRSLLDFGELTEGAAAQAG